MIKLLAIAVLLGSASPAAAVCDQQTTGLSLPIPSFNDSGDVWGQCMIDSFQAINDSAALSGFASTATFQTIYTDTITALGSEVVFSSKGYFADGLQLIGTLTLPDGAIVTAFINAGAVTTLKLGDGAVTSSKMDANAVATAAIQTGAVTTDKLGTDSVTEVKILDGAVSTGKVAADAVTEAKILNSAVTTSKLIPGAVTTSKVSPDAIVEISIIDSAVTTPKIATDAITEAKILDGSVTTAKIRDGAVTTSKLGKDIVFLAASGTASRPAYSFGDDPDTGMFSIAGNNIDWATLGVARMKLNASGLAIGRGVQPVTPLATLDIKGNAGQDVAMRMSSEVSGEGNYIWITDSFTYNMTFGANDAGAFSVNPGRTNGVAGTEVFVIEQDGDVGIGEPNPGTKLEVAGTITATGLVCVDCISETEILDDAVTTDKLAADSVTRAKIAQDGCTDGQILKLSGSLWACAADEGTGSGDVFLISTQTLSGANTFTSTTTWGATNKICRSDFTNIENTTQNISLGCMQTAEQGSATFVVAIEDCWDTYGGRLPTYTEWTIACSNFALTDETDDREWLSPAISDSSALVADSSCTTIITDTFGSTYAYRCFIPK